MDWTYHQIAKMIDHSLLKPTLTADELDVGCAVAIEYEVASVCILPYYLETSVALLTGSGVIPSTTIGFPHGGHTTRTKLVEASEALRFGARELDAVVNISKVLSTDWAYVHDELRQLVAMTHEADARVKVIFENCYLNDQHKVRLCRICGELGVDWVKTSTGYGSGGATPEDVQLMLKSVPSPVQVKAAGGIRDLDGVLRMRALGVTRIGASATTVILDECRRRLEESDR